MLMCMCTFLTAAYKQVAHIKVHLPSDGMESTARTQETQEFPACMTTNNSAHMPTYYFYVAQYEHLMHVKAAQTGLLIPSNSRDGYALSQPDLSPGGEGSFASGNNKLGKQCMLDEAWIVKAP